MAYIGTNAPTGFSTSAKDTFSGDNSTTAFTMSRGQSTGNDVQVFVDNVRQEPIIAYNVSGATLTFTEAPPTGTNNIYCVHNSTQATSVLPPTDLGSRDYVFGDDVSLKSDSAVLNFGLDSEVNITHVHNTGLLLNGTNQLQFGDSGTFIHQSADGVLDLVSDTELELNATTIDINGAVDISGNITLGGNIVSATTITTTGNEDSLTLASTDADANSGPHLVLDRQSSSPADSDFLGQVVFRGKNDAGENIDYATIRGFISDASDGTEDTDIDIVSMVGGTARNRLQIAATETVFNQNQLDIDFRVESDGNANMLVVDAGTNRVGIGNSGPASILNVSGDDANFIGRFYNDGNNTNREGIFVQTGTDDGSGTNNFFTAYDGDGSATGRLSTVSGTFQLVDTSDERLKQDIVDTTVNGITSINAMKVRDFAYKKNPTQTIKAGFVAQELQTVFPDAISYSDNDSDKILSVSRERLVPILVKALQELSAKNDALEARIKTLESA